MEHSKDLNTAENACQSVRKRIPRNQKWLPKIQHRKKKKKKRVARVKQARRKGWTCKKHKKHDIFHSFSLFLSPLSFLYLLMLLVLPYPKIQLFNFFLSTSGLLRVLTKMNNKNVLDIKSLVQLGFYCYSCSTTGLFQ